MTSLTNQLIGFGIILVILLIFNRIIVMALKRVEKKRVGSHRTIGGALIIVRIVFVLFIAITVFFAFNLEQSTILSISSVSGIIIGFASTEIVNQIIAGVYLITSHPFGIHDLVKIGNAKGIVVEVSLNYTKIKQFDGTIVKIPNKQLIDSEILNYTQKIDPQLLFDTDKIVPTQSQKLSEDEKSIFDSLRLHQITESAKKIFQDFLDYGKQVEVTRYTFDIEVEYSYPPDSVMKDLNLICENYKSIYGFQPIFSIIGLGWRAKFQFRLLCTSPHIIINQQNNLICDISAAIFSGGKIA